jgi:hypothetical protein
MTMPVRDPGFAATGFVSHPGCWWHWRYGDQYWAFHTVAPQARYGVVLEGPADAVARTPAGPPAPARQRVGTAQSIDRVLQLVVPKADAPA